MNNRLFHFLAVLLGLLVASTSLAQSLDSILDPKHDTTLNQLSDTLTTNGPSDALNESVSQVQSNLQRGVDRLQNNLKVAEDFRAQAVQDRGLARSQMRQMETELSNRMSLAYKQGRANGKTALQSFQSAREVNSGLREQINTLDRTSRSATQDMQARVNSAQRQLADQKAANQPKLQQVGVLGKIAKGLSVIDWASSGFRVAGDWYHAKFEGGAWANVGLVAAEEVAKKEVAAKGGMAGSFVGAGLGGAAGPAGAAAGGIGGAFVGSYEATQLFDQHAKPQFEKLRDDAAYAQALARYGYTAEEHRHFSAMRQLAREKAAREAEQERARLAQQAAREKQAQLERQRAEEIVKASQARKREEARAALQKQLASKEREPSVASPVKTQPPPRTSETTVSSPTPASRPAPPAKAPKDCWVLIETKIYKEKDCTASPGSATVQFPTFKISGSWTSPPAVMKPGETLKFQMSTSFAETGKMIGRYIGGNMEMDQDFVGTRPGYASRNHIVIGTATTDYNLGKLQSSKTGSYTVPKGTPGEKIMIRGLLHIGAPPITGAAYIYEYK